MVRKATHPDDLPRTTELARRARDPAERYSEPFEYRLLRPDGEICWVMAAGRALFDETPEGPKAVRYVGTIRDITAEKRAIERLEQSEARLKLAIDAGRMGVWAGQSGGEWLEGSPELNRVLGYPEDTVRLSVAELRERYLPGEYERVQEAARQALADGQRRLEVEFKYARPDGEIRWLLLRAEITLDEAGVPSGAIGVLMDVTERRSAQERVELLAREVDHRANNLLTVALATVRLSTAPDAADLRDVIAGRIDALARAHALIADSKWHGADMRRLVAEELAPFRTDHNIAMEGSELAISGGAAQSLGMVLHELATNAAKYGALSNHGRVEVSWWPSREGGLHVRWLERGGPPVTPPKRRGFGTRVIERTVTDQLGGSAEVNWLPTGLECRLYIPPQRLSIGSPLAEAAR
jgi:PAS domain S-box-containing protein